MYWLCCERLCSVSERCCLVVLAITEASSKTNKLVTHYLTLLAQNPDEEEAAKSKEILSLQQREDALNSYLYSLVRSEYSLQVQPIAMTNRSPQTRLPTVAAVMTLRGRMTVQLSSSVPSLQSTWPSQRQLSNTHLQTEQWGVCVSERPEITQERLSFT